MGTNVIIVRSELINDIICTGIKQERLVLVEKEASLVQMTQAAGFRMRREGLAYRLTWKHKGVEIVKRVIPDSVSLSPERKRIYRMRNYISKWSHRLFRISKALGAPYIYLTWARFTTSIYYGFAYHNGSFIRMRKRYAGMKAG
ncbi:MAG TPA: hypothetical protein VHO46_15400 [Bacteroidales bacterium]|nr:hypothetical protein [Bacteroidales bacterium]